MHVQEVELRVVWVQQATCSVLIPMDATSVNLQFTGPYLPFL